MKNQILRNLAVLFFVLAAISYILSSSQSPYAFQPGQEMSLAEKYNEGELPIGASPDEVAYMGQAFVTSSGDEIKLVSELSGGDIDINIKFANDPEIYKFRINTAIENKAEWENFEIIPFLRGAKDGRYHFWLQVVEK